MSVQHLQCRLYNTVLCCQDSPYLKGAGRLTHLSAFRLRINPWEWPTEAQEGWPLLQTEFFRRLPSVSFCTVAAATQPVKSDSSSRCANRLRIGRRIEKSMPSSDATRKRQKCDIFR